MKKIFAILAIGTMLSAASFGQATSYMKTSLTSSVDSVTAGSTTATYLYANPTGSYKGAAIQTIARRKTAAQGGTITMEGSNDASVWQAFTSTNLDNDSVTIADAATSSGKLIIPASHGIPWRYIRVKITNASSDTSYVRALATYR